MTAWAYNSFLTAAIALALYPFVYLLARGIYIHVRRGPRVVTYRLGGRSFTDRVDPHDPASVRRFLRRATRRGKAAASPDTTLPATAARG